MKVLTWNINGVRAVQKDRTTLKTILDSLGADVICLQETKVTRDMLDEPTAIVEGYESYFSFSKKKSGYSGTANYCKTGAIPVKAEEGLAGKLTTPHHSRVYGYGNMNTFSDEELHALDEEGRCVITQHTIRVPTGEEKEVAIINVYVPRAGDREDRHKYKLQFLTLLHIRAEALLKSGSHVIILGDLNLTHRQIDNSDPNEEYHRKSSRIWLNQLLQENERDKSIPALDANLSDIAPSAQQSEGGKFSDVFRNLHPLQEHAFTNWCTMTGARHTNFGRRLDYILIDTELAKFATHCQIMSDFEGSDHCPVIVTLDAVPVSAPRSPFLCSKFMPEFKGQQKKLSSFFTKATKPSTSPHKHQPELTDNRESSKDSHHDSDQIAKRSINLNNKCQTFTSLKRSVTGTTGFDKISPSSNAKKTKVKKKDSISDTKQISLTSFFSQKNNKSSACHSSPTKHKGDGYNSNGNGNANECISTNVSPLKSCQVPVVDCLVVDDDDGDDDGGNDNSYKRSDSNDNNLQSVGPHTDVSTKPPNGGCGHDAECHSESDKQTRNNETCNKPSTPSKLKSFPSNTQKSQASSWKGLLGGLPPPPLCPGHKEACVLRTVKKAGPNQNKQFYVCARPDGAPGNPQSRCDFFQWLALTKKK